MNLLELKSLVDRAIETAKEFDENPADVVVSACMDDAQNEAQCSNDIELIYGNNIQASGCVLLVWME